MPYIAINSENKTATFGKRSKPSAQYDREHQAELSWQQATANLAPAPKPLKENLPPSVEPGLEAAMANISVEDSGISILKQRQRQSLQPLDQQQRSSAPVRASSRASRTLSAQVKQPQAGPQVGPLGNAQRRLSTQSTVTLSSTSSRVSSYDPLRSMGVYVDPAAAAKTELVNTPPLPSSPAQFTESPQPIHHMRSKTSFSTRRASAASTRTNSTSNTQATTDSRAPGSRRSFLGLSTKMSTSSISNSARRSSTIQDIRRSIVSFSSSSTSLFRLSQSPKENPRVQPSMISLPTPSLVTREKMTNKMKTSQSLLSLGPDGSHGQNQEFAQSQLDALLELTSRPVVRPFQEFVEAELSEHGSIEKIGEASYSEVFAAGRVVYKIVPFGSLDQTPVHELMQEIQISKLVNAHDGFAKLLAAHVVQGEYDDTLLDAWDAFATVNISENARPRYESDQYYCVLVMENAGEALETFRLHSAHEAFDIFKQILWALTTAEGNIEFEHRDLHWGNVVIQRMSSGVKTSIIDFTLSRARTAQQVFFTRLDHPDFFRGKGDYQFDIYRYMQRLLVSKSPDQRVPDWSQFEPRTNVLWLHYIVVKLLDKLEQTQGAPRHKSDNVYRTRLQNLASTLDISNKRRFSPFKVKSAFDVLTWGKKHGFW